MTAIDTIAATPAQSPRRPWPRAILRPLARWCRHRQAVSAWRAISGLDERLREDLGLDFTDLAALRKRARANDPAKEAAQTNALFDLILRRRA